MQDLIDQQVAEADIAPPDNTKRATDMDNPHQLESLMTLAIMKDQVIADKKIIILRQVYEFTKRTSCCNHAFVVMSSPNASSRI